MKHGGRKRQHRLIRNFRHKIPMLMPQSISRQLMREDGAIMLEAVIVYPLTLLTLFYLTSLLIINYQGWYVQVVANQAATLVGETAKFSMTEGFSEDDEFYRRGMGLDTSSTNSSSLPEDLKELKKMQQKVDLFRYAQNPDKWEGEIEKRVKDYVNKELEVLTLVAPMKEEPTTTVKFTDDGFGRTHIEVTVKAEYKTMFGDVRSLIGLDPAIDVTVTGSANLLDLSDYLTTTHMVISANDVTRCVGIDSGTLGGATGRAEGIQGKIPTKVTS